MSLSKLNGPSFQDHVFYINTYMSLITRINILTNKHKSRLTVLLVEQGIKFVFWKLKLRSSPQTCNP